MVPNATLEATAGGSTVNSCVKGRLFKAAQLRQVGEQAPDLDDELRAARRRGRQSGAADFGIIPFAQSLRRPLSRLSFWR
jgi:hypothetical protein